MGSINDTISITEISRLTNKSRPTIYKWLSLYESGKRDELPGAVVELFDLIVQNGSKKDVYTFCEGKFFDAEGDETLMEIVNLLRSNKNKLNLKKIKEIILEELKNEQ